MAFMLIATLHLMGTPLWLFIPLAIIIALVTLFAVVVKIRDGKMFIPLITRGDGESIPVYLLRLLEFKVTPKISPYTLEAGKVQLPKGQTPAQNHVPIEEVRDGIVKTRHGNYAIVLEASSVNIDLQSEREKVELEDAFRRFLHSLRFPISIYSYSFPPQMDEYFETLDRREAQELNPLVQEMIALYKKEMQALVRDGRVISRKVIVVIPFEIAKEKEPKKGELLDPRRIREELYSRASAVIKELKSFQVEGRVLEDSELWELYYSLFDRHLSKIQHLRPHDASATLAVMSERSSSGSEIA